MAENHKHSKEEHGHDSHEHGGIFGKRSEFIFSLLCGVFLGVGFLIANVFPQIASWISLDLYPAA
jgi:Cd2+/Zn2+-exporting ATPase